MSDYASTTETGPTDPARDPSTYAGRDVNRRQSISASLDAAIQRSATERTAAFLVVASRNNGYEGRDASLVVDDLECGIVAGMLGIGIDRLGRALVDLEKRGLVVPAPGGGLRLIDIDALDRLSDGS